MAHGPGCRFSIAFGWETYLRRRVGPAGIGTGDKRGGLGSRPIDLAMSRALTPASSTAREIFSFNFNALLIKWLLRISGTMPRRAP